MSNQPDKERTWWMARSALMALIVVFIVGAPFFDQQRGFVTMAGMGAWFAFHVLSSVLIGVIEWRNFRAVRSERPAAFWYGISMISIIAAMFIWGAVQGTPK